MAEWISNNASNILVIAVLVLLSVSAAAVMRRNRKKGNYSCGGGCSGCPMGDTCHREK